MKSTKWRRASGWTFRDGEIRAVVIPDEKGVWYWSVTRAAIPVCGGAMATKSAAASAAQVALGQFSKLTGSTVASVAPMLMPLPLQDIATRAEICETLAALIAAAFKPYANTVRARRDALIGDTTESVADLAFEHGINGATEAVLAHWCDALSSNPVREHQRLHLWISQRRPGTRDTNFWLPLAEAMAARLWNILGHLQIAATARLMQRTLSTRFKELPAVVAREQRLLARTLIEALVVGSAADPMAAWQDYRSDVVRTGDGSGSAQPQQLSGAS